jgi:hypothetical protein
MGGQGLAHLVKQRAALAQKPQLQGLQSHFWYWPNWAS